MKRQHPQILAFALAAFATLHHPTTLKAQGDANAVGVTFSSSSPAQAQNPAIIWAQEPNSTDKSIAVAPFAGTNFATFPSPVIEAVTFADDVFYAWGITDLELVENRHIGIEFLADCAAATTGSAVHAGFLLDPIENRKHVYRVDVDYGTLHPVQRMIPYLGGDNTPDFPEALAWGIVSQYPLYVVVANPTITALNAIYAPTASPPLYQNPCILKISSPGAQPVVEFSMVQLNLTPNDRILSIAMTKEGALTYTLAPIPNSGSTIGTPGGYQMGTIYGLVPNATAVGESGTAPAGIGFATPFVWANPQQLGVSNQDKLGGLRIADPLAAILSARSANGGTIDLSGTQHGIPYLTSGSTGPIVDLPGGQIFTLNVRSMPTASAWMVLATAGLAPDRPAVTSFGGIPTLFAMDPSPFVLPVIANFTTQDLLYAPAQTQVAASTLAASFSQVAPMINGIPSIEITLQGLSWDPVNTLQFTNAIGVRYINRFMLP